MLHQIGTSDKYGWRLASNPPKTTGELSRRPTGSRRRRISWSRLLGLQFRRSLPLDAGLLVTPCRAIHTCFLRFAAIDAIFFHTDRTASWAVRRNVKPWRFISGPSQAHSVLETPARRGNRIATRRDPACGVGRQQSTIWVVGSHTSIIREKSG